MLPPERLSPEILAKQVTYLLNEGNGRTLSAQTEALRAFTASGALNGLEVATQTIEAFLQQATGDHCLPHVRARSSYDQ
jgi:hypothetical protein